jgi:hypothetical protein
MKTLTKVSSSNSRRDLLELMQEANFARIEGLQVRDGDPVVKPRPRVIQEIKFCAENGPRPERGIADFTLKKQVIELFALFDEMQNGTIDLLEVKHGLPFRVLVANAA